jgi:hypothetical protein
MHFILCIASTARKITMKKAWIAAVRRVSPVLLRLLLVLVPTARKTMAKMKLIVEGRSVHLVKILRKKKN